VEQDDVVRARLHPEEAGDGDGWDDLRVGCRAGVGPAAGVALRELAVVARELEHPRVEQQVRRSLAVEMRGDEEQVRGLFAQGERALAG
jgi:hypothetical protein